MKTKAMKGIQPGGGGVTKEFSPLLKIFDAENYPIEVCNKIKLSNSKTIFHFFNKAFTLAEVLITLGIIGVVAAMTLPSLIGNYNKKVTATRLERTYTVLSQAVERTKAEHGDVINWGTQSYANTAVSNANLKKILEDFTPKYIVPYLADIKKIEFGSFKDLGYKSVSTHKDATQDRITLNRNGVLLILNDGTILLITMDTGSANNPGYQNITIYADINGMKNPNAWGEDIFMFIVYSSTGKFNFYSHDKFYTREEMLQLCKSSASYCGRLIMMDGWEIKKDYPWL